MLGGLLSNQRHWTWIKAN